MAEVARIHHNLLTRLHAIDDQLERDHERVLGLRNETTIVIAALLEVLNSAQRQLSELADVSVPAPVSRTNSSRLVPTRGFKLKQVRIPYTANLGELRQRRLGGPVSLTIMAIVLLVIAWRVWLLYPFGAIPTDAERALSFATSRDSIITILLVFPALLSTQLERRAAYPVLADNSVGVATACAQAGLALPLLIAVLSVGDLRHNMVCLACAAAGTFLLAMAIWSYYFFVHPPSLARLRRQRVVQEVGA
jgi:hypothetical protein